MQTIKTSILIIGSGGAGLRCAIELYEAGRRDMLIIGDCTFGDAHTRLAEGGINAAFGNMDNEPDTPLVHAVDTFTEGGCVSNPHIVETLTSHAPEAINDLIRMGADFHKEPNGKLSQRYFGAHTYRRTIFKGDTTGEEIMRVLTTQVQKYQIPSIDKLYIFKLLVEDNQVRGAVGIKDERLVIIKAPIVVIATGGYSNIYTLSSSRLNEGFGDGIALAFEEGALVGDMEFVQFHPTGLVYPPEKAGELVTEAVRGEGGILKNALGEQYMIKYSPKKELATRDVVARANYREIIEGRGTKRGAVYLDISHRQKEYILERLPKMYKMLLKYNNIDITREPMEVAPTAHYAMGGIYFNENNYKTSVEGLYAVGECTMGVHGGNRLGGNSLAEIIVFGKLIGRELSSITPPEQTISETLVRDIESINVKSLTLPGSLDTFKTFASIRQVMWKHVGIVRTESDLKDGLKKLIELREAIANHGLNNIPSRAGSIIAKKRVHIVLDLAELVTRGAIERRESRGAHFRSDYPLLNNEFLKNILFQKQNGALKISSQPVPEPSPTLKKAVREYEKTTNYGHVE